MSLTLGGITLPDLWFDPESHHGHGVDGRLSVARNGTPLIWEQAAGHRIADLVGSDDMAWMTYAQVKAVDALVIAGAEYVLDYEGTVYAARFRTWDPPVISGIPVIPRPNQADTDYLKNIRIKLILTD